MLNQLKALADAQEKATPGPWDSDDEGTDIRSDNALIATAYMPELRETFPPYTDEEAISNANLIALSGSTSFRQLHDRMKAMEEALHHIKTLRERAEASIGMVDSPYHRALNAAVELARKALGETT